MISAEKQQTALQERADKLFGDQALTSFADFNGEVAQVVMKIESQEKRAAFTVLGLARFVKENLLIGEKHTWETGKGHVHEPFHCIDFERRNGEFLKADSNDPDHEALRWSNNRGLIIANYIAGRLLTVRKGHYLTGYTVWPERQTATQRTLRAAGDGGNFTTPFFRYVLQKRRAQFTSMDNEHVALTEDSWIA